MANIGSHRVESEADRRELAEQFEGVRYEHIQTGVKGVGMSRKERRRRRYRKPDRG